MTKGLHKVIWICWFQGVENAPPLVQKCIRSWTDRNPGWQVKCLDSTTVQRYVNLPDLSKKEITAASLSDIIRIELLHEYGGVWVDATLFCHKPLDEWLGNYFGEGFFAFDRPGPDRMVSSWFLAARENHLLIKKWHAATTSFWQQRDSADAYFWYHYLFGDLYEQDSDFRTAWDRVPKLSADGPHSLLNKDDEVSESADMTAPVYKLNHRIPAEKCSPTSDLWKLLTRLEETPESASNEKSIAEDNSVSLEHGAPPDIPDSETSANGKPQARKQKSFVRRLKGFAKRMIRKFRSRPEPSEKESLKISGQVNQFESVIHGTNGDSQQTPFASIYTKTENIGDHIQVIAGWRLLSLLGIRPNIFVERDDEIKSTSQLDGKNEPVPILMNGWYKNNNEEWPPHSRFHPLFIGFHIRLPKCPSLMSDAAVQYYKKWGPVGCRDPYTQKLLNDKGVDSYLSRCLTLTLRKRMYNPGKQTRTLVISRDEKVLEILPESIGEYEFLSHYSGSGDFEHNTELAYERLAYYAEHAGLIITTLVHVTLPAIAMGIPVVVIYPFNNEKGHQSDVERFSVVSDVIEIHDPNKLENIDWNGQTVDLGKLKLELSDRFFEMSTRWQLPETKPTGPIASPDKLPVGKGKRKVIG